MKKQFPISNDYPQIPNILINNPLTARWTWMVITCTLLFLGVFLLGLLLKNISFEWLRAFKHTHEIERIYEAYELKRFISVGEIESLLRVIYSRKHRRGWLGLSSASSRKQFSV